MTRCGRREILAPMMRVRAIVPAGMVYAVAPTAAVIMGDSLMYVVLPVAAVEFGAGSQYGLSASFWIGLALSINRFVRLASNAFAASLYQWFGVRWPFVGSIVLGALTTLAYGLGSGLVVLLAARALWGVAYSCMRLAAHLTAFAVGTSEIRGRLMGFFNSGQRSGSLVAVTAGALLYQLTSKEVTFTVLAGVGLLGVIVAVRVPDLRPERVRPTVKGLLERLNAWDLAVSRLPGYGRRLRLPLLSISLMSFATAFAANGLAIATVAPYIAEFADENGELFGGPLAVVTLAGLMVGFRWACDLGLGVPLGHLSDRIGRRASIAYGMVVMFGSLALMALVRLRGRRLSRDAAVVRVRRGSGRGPGRCDGRDIDGSNQSCSDGPVRDVVRPGGGAGAVRWIPHCRQDRLPGWVSCGGGAAAGNLGAVRGCYTEAVAAGGGVDW